ncbi:MAG TPA: hypothetical protein VGF95_16490 [Solirubrobacteraceae bacterium]
MTREDENPGNLPPRDFERDVLAERRARRSELQGDPVLLRRAETAEESARDLEGRLSGMQDRLRGAERECASATERLSSSEYELRATSERLNDGEQQLRSVSARLAAREEELRSVSERLATREQDLRLLSQRLVEREQQLRDAEREIQERIEGLERRVGEFKRELASERQARIAAEDELGKLRDERQRVEHLVVELKRVARRLRDVAAIEAESAPASAEKPAPAVVVSQGLSRESPPKIAAAAAANGLTREAATVSTPGGTSEQVSSEAAVSSEVAVSSEAASSPEAASSTAASPKPTESAPAAPQPNVPSTGLASVASHAGASGTNGNGNGTGSASGSQPTSTLPKPAQEEAAAQEEATGQEEVAGQEQAKGLHMAEALASAVERLRARVAAVGELNERRETAPSQTPPTAVPYAPPLPQGKQETRSWLAPAIRQMSEHGGARLAGELIVELLPAQAPIVKGDLRYLLRIEELGAFQIEIADGGASVRGVGNAEREEDAAFDPDFTLEGPAAAFAEFAAGGIQRRPKGLRTPGRRRRARRLFSARRKPLALTELVTAGVQVWPGLLLAALAEAVVPEWTNANTFAVAFSIEGRQGAVLDVGVRAGMPLQVTRVQGERGPDQPQPAATVRLGEDAFLRMLSGQPLSEGEEILVEGDVASLELLLTWTDRVQGLRRFAA